MDKNHNLDILETFSQQISEQEVSLLRHLAQQKGQIWLRFTSHNSELESLSMKKL